MSDRVMLMIHLHPDEYVELAHLARAAGTDATQHAANLVRAGLPGTQARVLDAARGTDADA